MRKNNPVTYGLIIVNVLIFAWMILKDPALSYSTLVDFGAKVNFRIVDFKLWHLITPMFLHGSTTHLLFNSVALYYFAPMVERWFGSKKFLFMYLAMGIIACLGSFISSDRISLGASGAIYGLMAFHLYLYLLNKEVYLRIFGNSMLKLIVFNILYSFIVPNIDIAGHLFGFIGGMILYFLVAQAIPKIPGKRIAILLLTLILVGSGFKAVTYRTSESYYIHKLTYLQEKGQTQEYLKVYREYQQRNP